MSTEVIQLAETDEEMFVSYIDKIRKEVERAADNWFHIAYYVYELNYFGYYKKHFDSIVDCCQANFGFKKSTTYNFIGIVEQFAVKRSFTLGQGMVKSKPQPQYVGYQDFFNAVKKWSYSQLVAMLSLSEKQREQATPDMSSRQIKSLKTNSKRLENKSAVVSDPVPAEIVMHAAEIDSVPAKPAPGSYFDYTVAELNEEISDYRKKYESERASNHLINCKLVDMTAERDKALQDIAELKEQLKKLRSDNRKLRFELKTLSSV